MKSFSQQLQQLLSQQMLTGRNQHIEMLWPCRSKEGRLGVSQVTVTKGPIAVKISFNENSDHFLTFPKVGVRASANWELCPDLTLPSGVAGTTCQGTVQFWSQQAIYLIKSLKECNSGHIEVKIEHYEASTCMVVCEEGKVATGRRRIKCRWKRKKGFFWKSVSG